ncbi:hypothetical protein [Azospirillum palustre]
MRTGSGGRARSFPVPTGSGRRTPRRRLDFSAIRTGTGLWHIHC